MAKYHTQTRYGVSDLDEKEFSLLTAGLSVLATHGSARPYRFPEHKAGALELLRVIHPVLARQIEKEREAEADAQAR